METTWQLISNDKTERSITIQEYKNFNSQPSASQAKKEEQFFSRMPSNEKAFDMMGDDIVDLSTENEGRKEMCTYDEKWLKESKANLLQKINDEKRANIIMTRMKKQLTMC